jgi:hypothetical protein
MAAAVSEQAILAIREAVQIGRGMERTPNGRWEKLAKPVGPDYAARRMRRPATPDNRKVGKCDASCGSVSVYNLSTGLAEVPSRKFPQELRPCRKHRCQQERSVRQETTFERR